MCQWCHRVWLVLYVCVCCEWMSIKRYHRGTNIWIFQHLIAVIICFIIRPFTKRKKPRTIRDGSKKKISCLPGLKCIMNWLVVDFVNYNWQSHFSLYLSLFLSLSHSLPIFVHRPHITCWFLNIIHILRYLVEPPTENRITSDFDIPAGKLISM